MSYLSREEPSVSVIVPFYDEEASIGHVLERLQKLKRVLSLEIVAVDDGSTDESARIAKSFSDVKLVSHSRNLGKGRAIISGLLESKGSVIVIQDSDCEYPPEEIPALVKPILKGDAEIVFGSRFLGNNWKDMSLSHAFGNRILSFVTSILYGVRVSDVMTGHKSFSREAIESIDITENRFEVEVEITAKLLAKRWKFKDIPIAYVRRQTGSSKLGYKDGLTSLIRLLQFRLKT